MPAHFLTIGRRDADLDFGRRISKAYGFVHHAAATAPEVRAIVREQSQLLAFWDIDHPASASAPDPSSAVAIGRELAAHVSPERVVAVSDQPLKSLPYVFQAPAFGHHVFRRADQASFLVYSRIATACLRPDPFGLGVYVPDLTPVKRIKLQKASHRHAAAEAVSKVFLSSHGHPRLAAMLAQTCDELLMNAIFSAPVDAKGHRYRAGTTRSDDFELGVREAVTLEYAPTDDYIAVLVSDQFGSLERERILSFIQKDYESQNYRPDSSASAGLGIYGTLQTGQSLLFVTKPGVRTDVAVFFPMVRSPKDFKSAFRFVSFIQR